MSEFFKKFKSKDDGRRKLSSKSHPAVKRYYKMIKSQRETAKHFHISRRLVIFILYPERLEKMKREIKEQKKWSWYYNKENHRLAIAKLRAKKKRLGYKITKKEADKIGKHSNA